jgi:D-psicose/D-tagatose/L-ribulose 3-epimerase
MRFRINSFLFTSPFTTKSTSLFPKFKKWGFDTVEIPIEAPEHIDSVKVRKALDKHGLACGSVCACMGPGRDFRGSGKDQREAMKYCKALIDHMVNLGCPSLIGPVYSVVGKADAVEPKEQKREFALVVKNLKVLCAYAEKKGVQICVEPLNRFETDFLNTCEKGLRLIKAVNSPVLKLHLDTFHMNIEETNIADALRTYGNHIGHVHFVDSNRRPAGCAHMDYAPIAAALKEIGYDKYASAEAFPWPDSDAAAKATIDAFNRHLA